MGFHYIPPAVVGAQLIVAETEVFNGTPPGAMTDLDLSGVVGSNSALVVLKIRHSASGNFFTVRKNGDTDFAGSGLYGHCAFIQSSTNTYQSVLVPTDSAGIIEWMAQVASGTTIVKVIAYIK